MAQITIACQIAIPNGPKLGFHRTIGVEAFDRIDIVVPGNTVDKEVQVQPGGAGQVQLLLITSDWFGPELSYKVNSKAGTSRPLDQPHLFAGAGAVSMIDAAAPAKLFISNLTSGAAAKDATIQILAGRDATP